MFFTSFLLHFIPLLFTTQQLVLRMVIYGDNGKIRRTGEAWALTYPCSRIIWILLFLIGLKSEKILT